MEFFKEAKAVRLRSHRGKYLVADDDKETVRQSRNASSHKARWTVELVEGHCHIIHLKSCFGKYLTASEEPYLLGMTGKKVLQTMPATNKDSSIDWEPIREGMFVMLRAKSGRMFLRANWGTPPWRNSVTHDAPHRTATQDWVLWEVEDESVKRDVSPASSFSSSYLDDFETYDHCSDTGSPIAFANSIVGFSVPEPGLNYIGDQCDIMELFQKAKAVRFRSHHDKYLLADDDEETVCQDRNGLCQNAKWTVEIVENSNVIRLKSCYGKYLTASNMPFLLGATGKKVLQTKPNRLDSSLEWEPIREGVQVRLKTRYGQFLRANGGLPPWRKSITHDIPHRTATKDWILWDVDVIEIRPQAPPKPQRRPQPILPPDYSPSDRSPSPSLSPSSGSEWGSGSSLLKIELRSPRQLELKSSEEDRDQSPIKEGRIIHFNVGDEKGDVEEVNKGTSFTFKGSCVEELKEKLQELTELDDILVCSRNPLNGKLYPLRLQLPPNNTDMNVVVVPSTFQVQ